MDKLLTDLVCVLERERVCKIGPLPASALAFLACSLSGHNGLTVVTVTETPKALDEIARNLNAISANMKKLLPHAPSKSTKAGTHHAPEIPVFYYPALNSLPSGHIHPEPDIAGDRFKCLLALQSRNSHYGLDPGDLASPVNEVFLGEAHFPKKTFRSCRINRQGACQNANYSLQSDDNPKIIATCIQALMQPTIPPASLQQAIITLKKGAEYKLDALTNRLEHAGYEFVPEVTVKGEASLRGGLLDVWPVNEPMPARMEFFGDSLESIRLFDCATQRSENKVATITITPGAEYDPFKKEDTPETHSASLSRNYYKKQENSSIRVKRSPSPSGRGNGVRVGEAISLTRHLPENTVFLWHDVEPHAVAYEKAAEEAGAQNFIIPFQTLTTEIQKSRNMSQIFNSSVRIPETIDPASTSIPELDMGFELVTGVSAMRHSIIEPDVFDSERRRFIEQLAQDSEKGRRVFVFFSTPGAAERFKETCSIRGLTICNGGLTDGFCHPGLDISVISESDITGYRKEITGKREINRRHKIRKHAGAAIADLTNIEPGDLVVHMEHGIGKYLGLYEVVFDGKPKEVLTIEYADKAKLHVPVAHLNLLSRYVGVGDRHVQLHSLGGRSWANQKIAAQKAVMDFAASLLEVQAARDSRKGFTFPHDNQWQHEFETAFPYEETDDQLKAITDIKQDMENSMPMDRLVCGDVGYGKTEAAMRAAFKAVMGGKQVAMLVPTTVLAQQHFDIFSERMNAYPVRIELLSRFRSGSEQNKTIKDLKNGAVDIVIGTHRLVQSDVAFQNLGLVIIDEEQRFGVEHKEKLKRMQNLVDVLTLTATPIPRTLYMSLTGARDISMIQTAPRERLPVETIVTHNTDDMVRKAILEEINRGGQIYYLHNRIISIDMVRRRLMTIVPEARIATGHGRMKSQELAEVMHKFYSGEFDVLLCTTIIESGVDIPNVNTIIIDRADRFGLAELHQLRGRVGRSSRKAHAYLLLAAHGKMASAARRRLSAIMKHTELGSGFKLALRDLEIRGAGNILGAAQSGHVAAVGFDLYCQLLRATIAQMKNDPRAVEESRIINVDIDLDFLSGTASHDPSTYSVRIPETYIEDETVRVRIYRKIASANTVKAIPALAEELKDRFGPVPEPVSRLLKTAEIKIIAADTNISSIRCKEGKLYIKRNGELLYENGKLPRLVKTSPDAMLEEIKEKTTNFV